MPAAVDRRVRLPELHEGQAHVLAGAGRYNVLECGRRWGKTQLGLQLAYDRMLRGQPVGWFSPTAKDHAEEWAAARSVMGEVTASKSEVFQKLRLITGGEVDFWSLDEPDSGRGRKYARVIIDEAGKVRDLQRCWEQTIRPTLADLRGDAWLLGTPRPLDPATPGANYFDSLFRRGQTEEGKALGWRSWRFRTRENPYISPEEVEAARRELPAAVFAQEFEGVPMEGGTASFFKPEIQAAARDMCRAPFKMGELLFNVDTRTPGIRYEMDTPRWADGHTRQRLKLWLQLDEDRRPSQEDNYVGFADISAGVGASNSTLGIARVNDRRCVATFTAAELTPDQFARHAVAVCLWFGGQGGQTMLGYEANGPGQVFGRELIRLGYRYIQGNRDLSRPSDQLLPGYGWWSTRDSKASLLSDLRRAILMGEYIPSESEMVDEMGGYVYYPSGAIGPASCIEETEGARKAHGDRVIRDAGLVLMLRSATPSRPVRKGPVTITLDDYEARFKSHEMEEEEELVDV